MKQPECPVHAYQRHGAEAEELRRRVEAVIEEYDNDEGEGDRRSVCGVLENILMNVDARDSLAYLEKRKKQVATPQWLDDRPLLHFHDDGARSGKYRYCAMKGDYVFARWQKRGDAEEFCRRINDLVMETTAWHSNSKAKTSPRSSTRPSSKQSGKSVKKSSSKKSSRSSRSPSRATAARKQSARS